MVLDCTDEGVSFVSLDIQYFYSETAIRGVLRNFSKFTGRIFGHAGKRFD